MHNKDKETSLYVPERLQEHFIYKRDISTSTHDEIRYTPVHCPNPGHFFTEDLPNIYFFNVTHVCGHCPDSIQKLVRLVTKRDVQFTSCTENNADIGFRYSCTMSWICNDVVSGRTHFLLGKEDILHVYNKVFEACEIDVHKPPQYDVVIFNRDHRRIVRNMDLLKEALIKKGYSFMYITEDTFISRVDQCDILRAYQSGKVVIGPYGADTIYSLMLRKTTLSMINSRITETFYEAMRGYLGYPETFKLINVSPDGIHPQTPGESYEKWRITAYLWQNLILSEENIEDIMFYLSFFIV